MLNTTHYFCWIFVFCNLDPILSKSCVCWQHYKIVFSAEHSLCCLQTEKSHVETPSKNTPFQRKGEFLVFSCACWYPYFCGVLWFNMITKKYIFPQKDSVNDNAHLMPIFIFRAQIVFCNFSKKCQLSQILFSPRNPKTRFFWAFFVVFLLFCVFFFSLCPSPT